MPSPPKSIVKAINTADAREKLAAVLQSSLASFRTSKAEVEAAFASKNKVKNLDELVAAMDAAVSANRESAAYWGKIANVLNVATSVAAKLV